MGLLPVKGGDVQITLSTTAATLAALVAAIDSAISNRAVEVTIQADPANTDDVILGDAGLSTTRYSTKLSAGDSRTYTNGSGLNAISTLVIYARGVLATPKINVSITTG
jgi:hypothetical protein